MKRFSTLTLLLAFALLLAPLRASAYDGSRVESAPGILATDSEPDPALPRTVLDEYADRVEIYAVRELDESNFEVFLRNGMIVTLTKSAVVNYVSCLAGPEMLASLGCEVAAGEVDATGAKLILEIFQKLMTTLVAEGYTLYPMGTLEDPPAPEDFLVVSPERVMRQDHMAHYPILYPWYEELRGAETKATTNLLFDFGGYRSSLEPISIEFIGPDYATGDGMTIYTLTDETAAARQIVLARYIQPTDDAWSLITAPPMPEAAPREPVPPTPPEPVPVPAPVDPTPYTWTPVADEYTPPDVASHEDPCT